MLFSADSATEFYRGLDSIECKSKKNCINQSLDTLLDDIEEAF